MERPAPIRRYRRLRCELEKGSAELQTKGAGRWRIISDSWGLMSTLRQSQWRWRKGAVAPNKTCERQYFDGEAAKGAWPQTLSCSCDRDRALNLTSELLLWLRAGASRPPVRRHSSGP